MTITLNFKKRRGSRLHKNVSATVGFDAYGITQSPRSAAAAATFAATAIGSSLSSPSVAVGSIASSTAFTAAFSSPSSTSLDDPPAALRLPRLDGGDFFSGGSPAAESIGAAPPLPDAATSTLSVFLAMVHPLTTLAGTSAGFSFPFSFPFPAPGSGYSFLISSARRSGSFRSRSSRCFAARAAWRHAPIASFNASCTRLASALITRLLACSLLSASVTAPPSGGNGVGASTRWGSNTSRYALRFGTMSRRVTRGPSAAKPDTAPKCVGNGLRGSSIARRSVRVMRGCIVG
mmetsp:Transcript_1888/g.7579  ORF Transcript_1888/g.7579 Transcript_1888/m.7579 type:complete len:291 (-) Transcript_1888:1080-1952(-)